MENLTIPIQYQAPSIQYIKISDGDLGIAQTIKAINDLVNKYSVDWEIISLARNITHEVEARDKLGDADALFYWVKQNIKYVNDPIEAELLQNPKVTLQEKAGDCDDLVILLGSFNKAIGNDIAFVTISLPGEKDFCHIYIIVIDNLGRMKGYDAASEHSFPGWVPPVVGRVRLWYDEKNYQDFLAGIDDFFKELFGFLKKTIDKAFKEFGRALRKAGLGGVLNEIGRAFFRIQKEFARWEDKMGIGAKFLIFGIKLYFLGAQPTMYALEKIVGVKNPFRMNREEWKLLAHIALLVASIVINVVTLGTTAYLLATSVILLLNAALTMVELHDQKKMREEAMDQLRAAEAKLSMEKRIQREALAKLEIDIRLLDEMLTYQKERERILTEAKIKYEQEINDIWYSAKQEVLNYRMKKELELQDYIQSLSLKYKVAI